MLFQLHLLQFFLYFVLNLTKLFMLEKKPDCMHIPHTYYSPIFLYCRRPDPSWVCVFCRRPSHFSGLGDLFGPYFVSSEGSRAAAVAAVTSAASEKSSAAAGFIIGGDSAKKKKKQQRKGSASEGGAGSPPKGGGRARSSERTTAAIAASAEEEVWFHEDCVCWMPDISLIGSRLIGEAVKCV